MATHKWSDRTTYQGHRVNFGTWFILVALNILVRIKRFGGETSNVTMLQGGYNAGGVAASAGTHDGGAAFDLTPFNWKWRVWLLRLLGCAAYYRPYNWDLRGGGAHIHVIVSGDGTASKGAKQQVIDFLHGLNGLANRAKDPNTRPHGLLLLFHYPVSTSLNVRYATKNQTLRDQPSSAGASLGTLKKNAKFTPIAWVKNSSGNLWGVNKLNEWAYQGDLTSKKPVLKLPSKPVPIPTPVPVPEPAKKSSVTLHIGTINVIRWRLGKKNVRNYDSFQKGLDYSIRVKGFAKMQDALGVSIFGTQESGQYADADLLTNALGKDSWTNILHGDDAGDITEANHVHEKRRILREGMITTGDPRPDAYHNTATWTLLQDGTGSDVIFLFVNTHGDYRPAGKSSASEYDKNREENTKLLTTEAKKIAAKAAADYKVNHVPVVYGGDWNQSADDAYDGVGKAMTAAGYIDTYYHLTSHSGPLTTTNGLGTKKTTGRRLDRVFVEIGTKIGEGKTVLGFPNTDHNGYGVELTLTNN
jgi:hypothetical protein